MLLGLVPGLEERLMECSEEELMAIANMVRGFATLSGTQRELRAHCSFKRVQPAHVPMIPRV